MKLRPYQEKCNGAIVRDVDKGLWRLLVQMATGLGKTVTFSSWLEGTEVAEWLASVPPKKGGKMLVIAHRDELITQAAEKIQRMNPRLHVSIEQADQRASRFSDVVVASLMTLTAMEYRRLKRLIAHHGYFPLVVCDEAHRSAANSYRTIFALLGFLPAVLESDGRLVPETHDDAARMEEALQGWDAKPRQRDRILVGVTATPNRNDAVGLSAVYQTISFAYPIRPAIDDGWLVPITSWVVESKVSLDDVKAAAGTDGGLNIKALARAVNNEQRNTLAVAAWGEHAAGLPTIGFAASVDHAHAMAAEFVRIGVAAVAIDGTTPKDDRRNYINAYRNSRITALCNFGVFTEGTDLPLTRCILHARPTTSTSLYEQMTGRGLRPLEGDPIGPERAAAVERGHQFMKPDCIVIDVADLSKKHSLQTASSLYGLPPGALTRGDDLRKMAAEFDAIRNRTGFDPSMLMKNGKRYSLAELLAQAQKYDVFGSTDIGEMAKVATMKWIRSGPDAYRIAYPWADGDEIVEVLPNLIGKFDIACTIVPRKRPDGTREPKRQRTLATGAPSAADAIKVAETFIRNDRHSAVRLVDNTAPWRKNPASKKQLGVLEDVKRFLPEHLPLNYRLYQKPGGSGVVSDLIDLAFARKKGQRAGVPSR